MGYEISDATVGNILRAKGIIPAPERGRKSNWKQVVRSHIFLGEKPLRRAVEQYVKHYHHEAPKKRRGYFRAVVLFMEDGFVACRLSDLRSLCFCQRHPVA